MNMKKTLSLLLAVMMLVTVMAGCTTKPATESPSPSPDASETPVAQGDFDVAVCIASEPQTIDPTLNSSVDGATMAMHMFEGLMKWVDDGEGNAELTLGQAKSIDKVINDDETVTYTAVLRDDIKWSDGEPVTAGDFVYSWQRAVDPATAADYVNMFSCFVGYTEIVDGTPSGNFEDVKDEATGEVASVEVMNHADPSTLAVKAVDDKTLEFTLTNDLPYFTELLAFTTYLPVRQSAIEAGGDQWTFTPETYISNGSYKLSEWVHNSYIKMVPNENYYDVANLGPTSITFQLTDDDNAALTAFQSNTLQFIQNVPSDEVPALLAAGEIEVVPYVGTYYVCFQNQKAPFDNALVREAFSLAIDRNFIVDAITQTGEVPADGFVAPGVSDAEGIDGDDFRTVGGAYYDTAADKYEANCEKARALLAEAGYPEGKGFPAVEYIYNTDSRHKAIAEALQDMWKTVLSVDVNITNQEWGVFLQTRKDGKYDIARNGWISDYNDPMAFLDMWLTGGGNNDAQYSSKEYDAAIAEAFATTDPAERMAAMHKAEDIMIGQDKVHAPIYFYTQKYMMNESVQGMYYSPLGYFFFNYATKAA